MPAEQRHIAICVMKDLSPIETRSREAFLRVLVEKSIAICVAFINPVAKELTDDLSSSSEIDAPFFIDKLRNATHTFRFVNIALEWSLRLRAVLPDLDRLLPGGDLLAPLRANAYQYSFIHRHHSNLKPVHS